MKEKIKELFRPLKLGILEIPNRIVLAPHTTGFANEDGTPTEKLIRYYEERARGGVGLITIEMTAVSRRGRHRKKELRLEDDHLIEPFSKLVNRIKRYDCKVAVQLGHAGAFTMPFITDGLLPLSASEITVDVYDMGIVEAVTAKEMTKREIEETIEEFANAAKRAEVSGVDAIELHGAHGYLIAQFLSPYFNKRNDDYGGDVINRARFAVELVKAVKEKLRIPVIFRISGSEFINGGTDIKESIIIAKLLEDAGVDALHVSAGLTYAPKYVQPTMYMSDGYLLPLAQLIKKEVSIPIIGVGKIHNPSLAVEAVVKGKVDAIAICRQLIADPFWPTKVKQGNFDLIRPCIACNMCQYFMRSGHGLRCTVNGFVGMEDVMLESDLIEKSFKKPLKDRSVCIIGGGPAGLEFARICALMGAHVTLIDSGRRLGGQLLLASTPSWKKAINNIIDYYEKQLKRLNVNVILQKEISPEEILKYNAEIIVIATGAEPLIPDVVKNVMRIHPEKILTAWDYLQEKVLIRNSDVIVVGAGLVGCETALLLAENDNNVTLVEMLPEVAVDAEPIYRSDLIKWLNMRSIRILSCHKLESVQLLKERIKVFLKDSLNRTRCLEADHLIIACGSISRKELYEHLKDKRENIYIIGDAKSPGKIVDAIGDAARMVMQIFNLKQ